MNKIKYLVVHCSDSPDDRDSVDAEEIHAWHKARGFDGIGYHAVIKRDGTLEYGRPFYWQGAHAVKVNNCSISICLVGRRHFTHDQYKTLEKFIKIEILPKLPDIKIRGHYQFDDNKTCPNFDVEKWWQEVKDD